MPINLPNGSTVDPFDDCIFLKVYAQTGKLSENSLIHIPTTAREDVFFACVVKVGRGRFLELDEVGQPLRRPMNLEPGDDVVFARYHGERIQIGEHMYVIMRRDDVLAKVTIPDKSKKILFKHATAGNKEDDNALDEAKIPEV